MKVWVDREFWSLLIGYIKGKDKEFYEAILEQEGHNWETIK